MNEQQMSDGAAWAPQEQEPRETRMDDAARHFATAVRSKLRHDVGIAEANASRRDWYLAVALAVRDGVVERWIETDAEAVAAGRKQVHYLSLEFLPGRILFTSLSSLGLIETAREALAGLGIDLESLCAIEPDPAFGNGGLGRLAACYMESMASLGVPAVGYGIRYEHGLFRQVIADGWQQEDPEDWLRFGNPWEFPRPERTWPVGFGGRVEAPSGDEETAPRAWHPAETVEARAFDTPLPGWRGKSVTTLRLWSARALDPLRLGAFNGGDFSGALANKMRAESITKVLYPSDATPAGQELRLRQEYFFTSASLQDLLHRHLAGGNALDELPAKAAIQLNDTHPALAVAELMRLLVDLHEVPWEEAWELTRKTIAYTNHTLLPEALETWPVPLLEHLLPRPMQIIYVLNARHLDELSRSDRNGAVLSQASLIDESDGRRVRMGHLAFLGSHKVNGVSALHTELMRQTVFRDLNALYPLRIVNKTNGISFRRWLFEANPLLTRLIVEALGERVLDDPEALRGLEPLAGDAAFRERYAGVRRANKLALARVIAERTNVAVDPDALFDVQIKRLHEYKRQLLNVLETVALYQAIRAEPDGDWTPRVKLFAGKAAPSYGKAKLIIKLINDVARVVNGDAELRGLLKVVFLPDYNVSLAEAMIPATDLSEQISTAGMEASGTGNMKLALNGALTIGTLDGANIEIRNFVGADNLFIFGLTAEEVETRRRGRLDARETIARSPALGEVLDAIGAGAFSEDDPGRFRGLVETVSDFDYFMVAADFDAYGKTQRLVEERWREPRQWWQMAVLNTARMGWFSADRAIREYCDGIWGIAIDPGIHTGTDQ
ncbi:MAG: glycogen/starch/alpha-glucan phosphorylase [Acetobacteraceae bacterium]